MMEETVAFHGGFYDISRKGELKAELDAISPHSDVVIDLSSTEYLDCSAVGMMVGKLRQWEKEKPGTRLRLRNVNRRLTNVMLILNLHRIFTIE